MTGWAHVGVASHSAVLLLPYRIDTQNLPQPDSVRRAQADWERWGKFDTSIGQTIPESGDAARDVVVVFARDYRRRVASDVVVVFGSARLSNMSSIGDSLIVVGGSASAAAGAEVEDDLVVIGGGFEAEPGFSPDGQHVVIGPRALGGRLEAIVPWITQGLLWGRPIVPNLPWVWTIVALFFLVVSDPWPHLRRSVGAQRRTG